MVGNKRLAIIARMDDSGLGHQTRDLVRLLNPDLVVVIDFTQHNGFKQHPEWYKDYNKIQIYGFIQDYHVNQIVKEVDIVLTAETFYNNNFIEIANRNNVSTVNHVNYEFFEPLSNRRLLIPTKIVMPSYWHVEDLQQMTDNNRVEYLPPPTFIDDYEEVRTHNINRSGKKRFLHVAGKIAAHDRAGTLDLIEAVKYSKEDFELVIKVQSGQILDVSDPRVMLDYSFPEDERELYRGFDAMIQPRRYAGLNLPMNEALSSALPVIMTDISPNNKVLPKEWLVPASLKFSFIARTVIDTYSADHEKLGVIIDRFATMTDEEIKAAKQQAYEIANREYSDKALKEKWALLLSKIGV